jgi:hypothetical protein
MKRFTSLTFLVLALGIPLAADAASPSVDLDVKIEGKADYKGSSTKTQSRTLNIKIANWGKAAVTDLKVKWWIFGHNMKDHKLIVIKEGESKTDVPAMGETKVTSPEVKVTGTRKHKVSSRKGRGRRSRTSTKTVPASGQEYYGYAVEVYSGQTPIAAYHSKPSIKEYLHPSRDR